jgi:hypothetical protein
MSKNKREKLTGMDNVHGTHGTTGIVEDVLYVQVDIVGVLLVQLRGNVADNAPRVVAMGRDSALGQVVEVLLVKNVKGLEVLLQEVEDGRQDTNEDGDPGQKPGGSHCACGIKPRKQKM